MFCNYKYFYNSEWARVAPLCPKPCLREGISIETIHFMYPMEDIQREVNMRTSTLGKYRSSESAAHLLDLISMTPDEREQFYSFAKDAMHDVFAKLSEYTIGIPKSLVFDKNDKEPIVFNPLGNANIEDFQSVLSPSEDGRGVFVDSFSVSLSSIDPHMDPNQYGIELEFSVHLNTSIETKSGAVTKLNRDVRLSIPKEYIICTDTIGLTYKVLQHTIPVSILREASDIADGEVINHISSATYPVAKYKWLHPITFRHGDVLSIDSVLYDVTIDTNSNDFILDEHARVRKAPSEFKEGIHYLIVRPHWLDETLIDGLDNALFSAIVTRIIFKWLTYSYPAEAASFLQQYEESLDAVRFRSKPFKRSISKKVARFM